MKRRVQRKKYIRKFDISFAQKYPKLLKDWFYAKNKIDPTCVAYGSKKEVWLKCQKCGHIKKCEIRNIHKTSCLKCKSFGIRFPNLSKEWHSTKNGNITPFDISFSSHKKIHWKCRTCGHEWITVARNRPLTKTGLCPKCSKSRTYNNNTLAIKNPKLAKEWDFSKNNGLTPNDIAPNSAKRVSWVCPHGHRWESVIASRNSGRGCPYCLNRKIDKNNCLSAKNPEIAKEWHPTKNGKLTPEQFAPLSGVKVWWLCPRCLWSWAEKISVRHTNGCPRCNKIILKSGRTCDSIIEAYLYLMLKNKKEKFIYGGRYGGILGKRRYDFYLPNENLYIEITSYKNKWKHWKNYYKNISYKRSVVTKKMHAKFKFIQMDVTKEIIKYVRKHSRIFTKPLYNGYKYLGI